MSAAAGIRGRGITSPTGPAASPKPVVAGESGTPFFNPDAESFRLPGPDADGKFVPGPRSISDGSIDQTVMRAAYDSGFDKDFGKTFRSAARKMLRSQHGDNVEFPEESVNELAYRLTLKHIDDIGSDPAMRGSSGGRKRGPQRGPNSVEFKDYLRLLAREEFNAEGKATAARPEQKKIEGVLKGKQPDYSGDEDADIAQNAPNARLRRIQQISTDGTVDETDPETGQTKIRQTSAGISDEMLSGEFEDLNPVDAPVIGPAPLDTPLAQLNSQPPVNVNVNMPEQRFEAPQVHVNSPIDVHIPEQPAPNVTIRQEAPQVHVAPEVFIERSPEPEIVEQPGPKITKRSVERDELGRIATIIDEVIS
jgi:hypothetical protein